jgi:hypothetical protein
MSDIEVYRSYLMGEQPIAEIEARFLDATDDLVTLGQETRPRPPSRSSSSSTDYIEAALSDTIMTPMPHNGGCSVDGHSRDRSPSSCGSSLVTAQQDEPEAPAPAVELPQTARHVDLPHLAIATAVAVLVPILTFAVIPSFVGRMTIVLLVALTVFGAQVQAGTVGMDRKDLLQCMGVYGGVMAVMAGLFV